MRTTLLILLVLLAAGLAFGNAGITQAQGAHLDLTPDGGTATAGVAFTITVAVHDASDNVDTGYTGTVHFASSDQAATLPGDCAFQVSDNGSHTFTNGVTLFTKGNQTITVTDNTGLVQAQSTWAVSPGDPDHIAVAPNGARVTAGFVQVYEARLFDYFNNEIGVVTDNTVFSTPLAAGGFWTKEAYTSEYAGEWEVTGTCSIAGGPFVDTVWLEVEPSYPDHLVISPDEATITAGDNQTYTVQSYDEFNNLIADVTHSTWSTLTIQSEAGGSWSGSFNNVYNSQYAGTWEVTGSLFVSPGYLTDKASLTVNPAPASRLEVTGTATMTAGGTNDLTITAKDSYGNVATSYTGSKSLTFSGLGNAPGGQVPTVEGVDVGSSTAVTFTAGISDAGTATLVAYRAESTTLDVTDGTIGSSGSAAYDLGLTVNPAQAVSLALTPAGGSTIAGASFAITVTAYDAFGNIAASHDGAVHFTSTDSAAILPSDYTFVSGDGGGHTFSVALLTAGSQSITVTDTGNAVLTDTESWSVNPGYAVHRIIISPDTADVVAGDNVTYTALAFDEFGNPIGDVTSMTAFEVGEAAGGAWTGTYSNAYTSYTAGTWVVTGTYNGLTDSASLTVNAGALHHIAISPYTGAVIAGNAQAYAAEAFDQWDNSLGDVTEETAFQVDGAAAGWWVANVYTSQIAGRWTVSGTYAELSDMAILVVNPGSIHHYGVSSSSYSQIAGVAFTVTVTAYDAFDNVVIDSSTVVTMSSDSEDVAFDANGDGTFDDGAQILANGTFTIAARSSGPVSAMTIIATSDGASGTSPAFTVTADPALIPPVAADDSYDVPQDTILMAGAPGVLANDTGAEGDSLTAILVSSVTHGTLRLKPDGSFTYTPDSGFSGSDSFTYKVAGSVAESNIATVTINVQGVSRSAGVSPWVWAGPLMAVGLLGSALILYRFYRRGRAGGRRA